MTIFHAMKTGASQSFRNKKMVFLFFFCNFGFSLVLVLPVRSLIGKALGHRLASQELAGPFSFLAFADFMHKYGSGVSAILNSFLFLAFAYVILNSFLLGGVIGIFSQAEQNFTLRNFISKSGEFWGRFFRLLLISALFYGLIWMVNMGLASLMHAVIGETGRQSTSFILWIVRYIFILLILLTVAMIFDYARIETVLKDKHKMFRTTFGSMYFAFKNFPKTFGLYFILFLIGLLFIWTYNLVADLFSSPASLIILLLFIWQQFYMLSKFWLKLTFYSSQVNLYTNLTRASREESAVV